MGGAALRLIYAGDCRGARELLADAAAVASPGCELVAAGGGGGAPARLLAPRPDALVLDATAPSRGGLELCRRVRERSRVPILLLSARDSAPERVRAYELGADDLLAAPPDDLQLLSRLRALAARACPEGAPGGPSLLSGGVGLDPATERAWAGGRPVRLAAPEYRLLEELVRHAGRSLPRRRLLRRAWGPDYAGEDGYLGVLARRLRSELGDGSDPPRLIRAEWGVGYRFEPGGWDGMGPPP